MKIHLEKSVTSIIQTKKVEEVKAELQRIVVDLKEDSKKIFNAKRPKYYRKFFLEYLTIEQVGMNPIKKIPF